MALRLKFEIVDRAIFLFQSGDQFLAICKKDVVRSLKIDSGGKSEKLP
jgi:hypothetical protein